MPKERQARDRVKRRPFCSEPSCRWHDYPVYGETGQLWDTTHWPKLQRFWTGDRWLCFECSGGKGASSKPRDDRGSLPNLAASAPRRHDDTRRRFEYGRDDEGPETGSVAEVDEVLPHDEDDPAF